MGDLHLAPVSVKVVVKERSQWRTPELKSRLDATQASVAEGVDAANSACSEEECYRVFGPGFD